MKTEMDNRLDRALDRYFDCFGVNFPLCIGRPGNYQTPDEIIERIQACIDAGEPEPEVMTTSPVWTTKSHS